MVNGLTYAKLRPWSEDTAAYQFPVMKMSAPLFATHGSPTNDVFPEGSAPRRFVALKNVNVPASPGADPKGGASVSGAGGVSASAPSRPPLRLIMSGPRRC